MTRPIRVCYLIDGLTRAGTETQLLALIKSLDIRRVQPSLVLLNGDDDLSRELIPRNCPVLTLGVNSLHTARALSAGAKLARFWRRERIDLVQTYFLDSTYFGVPLARISGVRRVVRVRNNLGHWLTPKHRVLGRVMGRLVDATLTNCEPARRALLTAEGGSPRKVVVLENGVNSIPRTTLRQGQGPPRRVGAVANLRPVKGVAVLIQAAALLARRWPDVTFHVAGEGAQRLELERLIERQGLSERFVLEGTVADIPKFLNSLDVFVLPSFAEGMSNAVLEAMAAARPIVATDVGANSHVLAGGRCGLLTPPGDPQRLAGAVEALLSIPSAAWQLGEAARRHVAAHYSREAMVKRFEDFYERLCA
jgi:glycosyltransferase involved in cell wall biosynthesis